MKTMLLILFSILPVVAMAQARTVEPVRLVVVTDATDAGEPDEVVRAFHDLLKLELNKRRNVVISERDGLSTYIGAQPILKNGVLQGYAVAVVVISDKRPREKYWLKLATGPTLQGLAAGIAKAMSEEIKGGK